MNTHGHYKFTIRVTNGKNNIPRIQIWQSGKKNSDLAKESNHGRNTYLIKAISPFFLQHPNSDGVGEGLGRRARGEEGTDNRRKANSDAEE